MEEVSILKDNLIHILQFECLTIIPHGSTDVSTIPIKNALIEIIGYFGKSIFYKRKKWPIIENSDPELLEWNFNNKNLIRHELRYNLDPIPIDSVHLIISKQSELNFALIDVGFALKGYTPHYLYKWMFDSKELHEYKFGSYDSNRYDNLFDQNYISDLMIPRFYL